MIAHIGKIPVEEWLPFVVPVLALYLYGRRKERRRREAVGRLGPPEALDADAVERVMASWSMASREGLAPAHVPLLYPPGPDGMSVHELAARAHEDPAVVERLLEELEDLGYLSLEARDDDEGGPRAGLTIEGYALLYDTEAALLAAANDRRHP
jgi:hypothetical protein